MNVLVTGSRAPIAADLAKALAQSGHKVWVADSLLHPVSASSPWIQGSIRLPSPRLNFSDFAKGLATTCTALSIKAIVPTSEEVFWLARAVPLLPAEVNVRTSSLTILAQLHHKGIFAQLATGLGYGAPENIDITKLSDIANLGNPRRFVLKPVYSRFATQVLISPKPHDLAHLSPSPEKPWLAQTRIFGRELSAYNVAHEGRLLLHVGYEPKFRVRVGASVYFSPISSERLREMSARIIKASGFTGQISFDAIETDDGIVALECNPRGTSGVHLAVQQPSALANSLLGLNTAITNPPFTAKPRMLLLPLLLHHPGLLFSSRGWSALRSAKDAMAPAGISFVAQAKALVEITRLARRLGVNIPLASTHDIEWNGEVDVE
jgi:hypothetical protein